MEVNTVNLSDTLIKMYDLDPVMIEALKAGDESVVFQDLVFGLFSAVDCLVTERYVDLSQEEEVKYQFFQMMNWAGNKFAEIDR